ncbi:MAG: sulfatase-like hydrolase/transferase [Phycisphaerae bacterium]|nr:sulfatase-like hydrolase/transferase [Phycisphaerae bacterium]NIW72795.1 sulfatase-like hydrolase/transferase [candidate division KSB1 bacterium]NIS51107.1 sulfatase-like hydrolase/transferase [Phycisphaerae bacterium]NIU09188.1 sulfatase-like hydrolase/transferase [Phycisphaerae bacterium]NIU56847.1 sulfatase-like hydrolase/transferase [Phycisphaerae bacterium]
MAGSGKTMNRRQFLRFISGSAAALMLSGVSLKAEEKKSQRPNILWVSCEDTSPDLGCYGDKYAVTPNIDKLAAAGVRYTNAYAHAGVCAPARSGIITGMYPTTIGTHHMRCQGVPPAHVKCFTEYLRAAGYYCTNNSKTDYQFAPPTTAWDESSRDAHWKNRAPGQPFFAVFNFTTSHESKIRDKSKGMRKRLLSLKPHERHDPVRAVLPPYYPDNSTVRRDWAQYYDVVTLMDKEVGKALAELEKAGLADDTIVWFWGDHGRGLPRGKRWIYDSGIHVPLIIRVPEKWRKLAAPSNPGALKPKTVNEDLVAFIDFAPTMLSLAGVKIPSHIQGRAFLGSQKAEPREYIFAARDRMDEAYDLIRAVRDKRYKYIRNYMPHLTRGQDINYMNQMPTMKEMRSLNAAGKLEGPQKQYFEPTKPLEELYDTLTDPHEVKNLAKDQKYKDVLERMRKVHTEWVVETSDIGLIPEPEFDEMKRPGGVYQKTAKPWFLISSPGCSGSGAEYVTINCATAGASIAYRIEEKGSKQTGFKLYTKHVLLKPGQLLRAKACRIGFKDSEEAKFKLGDSVAVSPVPAIVPHWRTRLDRTDLLVRLRKIKRLDGLGARAIADYIKALNDKSASVRYWAVVGLHNNYKKTRDIEQTREALRKMLADPSPVVRIASAHALCDLGRQKQSLPVLIDALKYKNNKAGLHAVIALKKIGEKARPALPQIKDCLKDSDGYVKRVTQSILKNLGST